LNESKLIEFAMVVILGISAQWIAWRVKMPSILFLLLFGFIGGPVTNLLHPDELMGELLLPVVSLSVAIILFEGGLSLKLSELKEVGGVVVSLISFGAIVTWILVTAGAHLILGLDLRISILLGAILIVTGPTVIGPLLRHIKPKKRVATILKWEGIMIDPVGAILAVLVFEAIIIGEFGAAGSVVLLGLIKTTVVGGVLGYAAALILLVFLRKLWIPDTLQESAALVMVLGVYILSNIIQHESGLLAVTLMGLFLDNQKHVSLKAIIKFKENLRVIIISIIFILLAARLELDDFNIFNWRNAAFLGLIMIVARPLSVYLSTMFSELKWNERLFVALVAPRGIVAAAVASIFALQLSELEIPGAEEIVPLTFIVIIVTVTIYGIFSSPIARLLKVAQLSPQGLIFVGAHNWARSIAKVLVEKGIRIIMIDTNYSNITQAKLDGIPAYQGSILYEHIADEVDLNGIGRLLAMTSNDEANSLAALNLREVFEQGELYQLPPSNQKTGNEVDFSPKHLRARFLFGKGMDFSKISGLYNDSWTVKSSKVTKQFSYSDFLKQYNQDVVLMFIIKPNRNLLINTLENQIKPEPEDTIVALIKDND
jgi:NhaP-type Na+/H+ or K+/H+ antiporter